MPVPNKNTSLAINLTLFVLGMIGLAYASVPLYRIFCERTGFGGTPSIAKVNTGKTADKLITIRFNTDTDPNLPWKFSPDVREIQVKPGDNALAFFKVINTGASSSAGIATYNVTPDKAGAYFNKIKCFCFDEQVIKAGEEKEMPVSFFIDPEIATDRKVKDIDTITLSYTFFKAKNFENRNQ